MVVYCARMDVPGANRVLFPGGIVMKKLNPWKVSTIVLAGACTFMLASSHLSNEPQPRMKAALAALKVAEHNLVKASADKGGHRVAAIGLTRMAMKQVRKGIIFDNKHKADNKKRPKPRPRKRK